MSNKETKTATPSTPASAGPEEIVVTPQSTDASFTEPKINLNELAALIAAAMKTGSEATAETLAKAFAESRKPYIKPEDEENNRAMREQMREQAKQIRLAQRADKEACPHLQGSSPSSAETTGNKSSFCLLKLPTGEVVGVCSNCQMVISNRHPKHLVYFKKKGGNELASAGNREFGTGEAYQRASTHSVVSRDEA